jgi:hypothetical protein
MHPEPDHQCDAWFNAALFGARSEEMAAVVRYVLRQRSLRLAKVWIVVDSLVFAPIVPGDWRYAYGGRLCGVSMFSGELLARQYLARPLPATVCRILGSVRAQPYLDRMMVPGLAIDDHGIGDDGYFSRQVGQDPERRRAFVRAHVRSIVRLLPPVQEIDPRRLHEFEAMLDQLDAHEVDVTVITAPFHPSFWAMKEVRTDVAELADETLAVFRGWQAGRGLRLIEMSDPSVHRLDEFDFWDGGHLTAAGAAKAATMISSQLGARGHSSPDPGSAENRTADPGAPARSSRIAPLVDRPANRNADLRPNR